MEVLEQIVCTQLCVFLLSSGPLQTLGCRASVAEGFPGTQLGLVRLLKLAGNSCLVPVVTSSTESFLLLSLLPSLSLPRVCYVSQVRAHHGGESGQEPGSKSQRGVSTNTGFLFMACSV